MNHQLWKDRTWWIKTVPDPIAAELAPFDQIQFENLTSSQIRIKSIKCSHGTTHGTKWTGVLCTGSGASADGTLPGMPGESFTIKSSRVGENERLDCEAPTPSPPTAHGGICWTAEDTP